MRAATGMTRASRPRGSGGTAVSAGPAAAVICAAVAVFSSSAAAFETPSVAGLSLQQEMAEDQKGFRLFLGVAAGTDSNYNLASPASLLAKESSVTEVIGGVAVLRGNYRRRYEARYQAQMDSYAEPGEAVLRESRAVAGFATHSQKVEFGFRARYASLSDLIELETQERTLGRDELAWTPEVSVSTGRTDFGFRYTSTSMSYDATESRLDHDNSVLGVEARWWRSEVTQLFFHYDSGRIDYGKNYKSDFDYSRIYAGLRTEAASRKGLSLGVGVQQVDAFAADPTLSGSRIFAQARFSFSPEAGTSKAELGCALVDEASARSAYKSVTMLEARFLHQVNRRLNWSVRLRTQSADLQRPEPSTPDAVSGFEALAGVNLDVGSVDKTHGRVFATVAYQTRSADHTNDDYNFDRLRVSGGFALVY